MNMESPKIEEVEHNPLKKIAKAGACVAVGTVAMVGFMVLAPAAPAVIAGVVSTGTAWGLYRGTSENGFKFKMSLSSVIEGLKTGNGKEGNGANSNEKSATVSVRNNDWKDKLKRVALVAGVTAGAVLVAGAASVAFPALGVMTAGTGTMAVVAGALAEKMKRDNDKKAMIAKMAVNGNLIDAINNGAKEIDLNVKTVGKKYNIKAAIPARDVDEILKDARQRASVPPPLPKQPGNTQDKVNSGASAKPAVTAEQSAAMLKAFAAFAPKK